MTWPLTFMLIYVGAIATSIIVGFYLRYIYRNSELRVFSQAIVVILGAFGVFFVIFSWSLLFFDLGVPLGVLLPTYGFAVIYSLIFGLLVTSRMNKTE